MQMPLINIWVKNLIREINARDPKLNELNIDHKDITTVDFELICDALKKNPYITSLDINLGINRSLDLSALRTLKNIKVLKITALHLSSNVLGRLTEMNALESLNLSHCRLSLDAANEFPKFKHLRELSLASNQVRVDSAISIANIPTLETIKLVRGEHYNSDLDKSSHIIASCPTLRSIQLVEISLRTATALANNENLQSISYEVISKEAESQLSQNKQLKLNKLPTTRPTIENTKDQTPEERKEERKNLREQQLHALMLDMIKHK